MLSGALFKKRMEFTKILIECTNFMTIGSLHSLNYIHRLGLFIRIFNSSIIHTVHVPKSTKFLNGLPAVNHHTELPPPPFSAKVVNTGIVSENCFPH